MAFGRLGSLGAGFGRMGTGGAANDPLPSFDPSTLFGGGETGDWWVADNLSKIWQNSGRSVAGAAGSAVGAVDGNVTSNHLLQATSAARPVLAESGGLYRLSFDGVDDGLHATFTLNQPFTRISAIRQVTWSTGDTLFDGATINLARLYQAGTTPNVRSLSTLSGHDNNGLTLGTDFVLTEIWNGASSKNAVNNASYVTGNPGVGNPGGLSLARYISGGTPGGAANIEWSGTILIGRVLDDAEIALCRTFLGAKMGLTL